MQDLQKIEFIIIERHKVILSDITHMTREGYDMDNRDKDYIIFKRKCYE